MKRIIAPTSSGSAARWVAAILVLLALMMCLASCGSSSSSDDSESGDADKKAAEVTIESTIGTYDGMEKQGDEYIWASSDDGVTAKYIFDVDGNDVTLKCELDYGSQNSKNAKLLKEDKSSTTGLPADWLIDLASNAGVSDATISYTVYVGDTKVNSGTMDMDEAEQAAEESGE